MRQQQMIPLAVGAVILVVVGIYLAVARPTTAPSTSTTTPTNQNKPASTKTVLPAPLTQAQASLAIAVLQTVRAQTGISFSAIDDGVLRWAPVDVSGKGMSVHFATVSQAKIDSISASLKSQGFVVDEHGNATGTYDSNLGFRKGDMVCQITEQHQSGQTIYVQCGIAKL